MKSSQYASDEQNGGQTSPSPKRTGRLGEEGPFSLGSSAQNYSILLYSIIGAFFFLSILLLMAMGFPLPEKLFTECL